MVDTHTDAWLRLLQLSSSTLPVGGFSFSQGLESAVEHGWITDSLSTYQWLSQQLIHSIARLDLPVFERAMAAWESRDEEQWRYWNSRLMANRETSELQLAEFSMGEALAKLLVSQNVELPSCDGPRSFAATFACAAVHWQIESSLAMTGYLWSWLENQVSAASKLVPLGQTQAQTLLGQLQAHVRDALALAKTLDDDTLGCSLPALAIISCQHEHQYSRLFRS